MRILSLFNGISCGRLALERAGISIDRYVSYEIDSYANQIAKKNYPDDEYLGDVRTADFTQYKGFDLIIGGSPCTHWSIAKRDREITSSGEGYELFSHFVRAIKETECQSFLYENNFSIHKNIKTAITEALGVQPIMINSDLVSAQNRKRMYWTNIQGIEQPQDKGILLKDIVLDDVDPVALHNLYGGFKEKAVRVFEGKSPTIRTAAGGGHTPSFVKKGLLHTQKALDYMDRQVADGRNPSDFAHHSDIEKDKSSAVVANFFKGIPYNVFRDWDCIRKFHPIECERLQTIPDNYTELGLDDDGNEVKISNTQRYKGIGNGWTIDVIAHILKNMQSNVVKVDFPQYAEIPDSRIA